MTSASSASRVEPADYGLGGLADVASDIVYRYELVGRKRFSYVNSAVETITGYPAQEHRERPELWRELTHPEDLPLLSEVMSGEARSTSPHVVRVRHKDGRTFWVEHRHVVVRDTQGAPVAVQGIGRDVTDSVLAREQLRRAEAAATDHARRQQALARIADAVVRDSDADRLLALVLRLLRLVLEADWSSATEAESDVLLAEAATAAGPPAGRPPRRLRRRMVAGDAPEIADTETLPVVPGTFAHTVLGSSGVVTLEHRHDGEAYPNDPWLEGQGVRASIGASFVSAPGVVGALSAHRRSQIAFTKEERQFFRSVADLITAAFERRNSQEALRHQALHDALTGLPNRALLGDRIDAELVRAVPGRSTTALLLLDLDDFKLVNDSLGHQAGDELLVQVADRLRAAVRPQDTVARLGGDEFAVLCSGLENARAALVIAERIRSSLSRPVQLGASSVVPRASCGITVAGAPAANPRARRATQNAVDMLREADTALYRAKAAGGDAAELFDARMRAQVQSRLRTEADLRGATVRGEFALVYQPVIELDTDRLVGVEALVRWNHPVRGLVGPDDFIGVAEETGLITEIGDWVLQEAARQAAAWNGEGAGSPLLMAVNLSMRQLNHPGLVDRIRQALTDANAEPTTIMLEITESALAADATTAGDALRRLAAMGMRLAVDDFGTGYSSLARLKRFPVSALKIDRSFVSGMGSRSEDTAIVSSIVALGQALGHVLVAEGIEDPAWVSVLRSFGCHRGQGFLFSRPVDADTIERSPWFQARAQGH